MQQVISSNKLFLFSLLQTQHVNAAFSIIQMQNFNLLPYSLELKIRRKSFPRVQQYNDVRMMLYCMGVSGFIVLNGIFTLPCFVNIIITTAILLCILEYCILRQICNYLIVLLVNSKLNFIRFGRH